MNDGRNQTATAVVLLTGLLAFPSLALAHHTIFNYAVDRFELDGNQYGAADGTPDVVDDFTSGSLSPNWFLVRGTAYEGGGLLHLTNPGEDQPPEPGGLVFDESGVITGPITVINGAGSFTSTSFWQQATPNTNDWIFFAVNDFQDLDNQEILAIGLTNFAPDVAALGVPAGALQAGLQASQVYIRKIAGVNTPENIYSPISAPTGQMVFKLAFDDATKLATTSFSLDGGATFQSPFPPRTIFNVTNVGRLGLVVDPVSMAHDSVVLPPKPVAVTIPVGQTTITKIVHVMVRNADVLPTPEIPGHTIQLAASDGDCPAGTVGTPDFDRKTAGPQDSALVAGVHLKAAAVPVTISSTAFTSLNNKSPARCTASVGVATTLPAGSAEPSPKNNSAPLGH